MIYSSFLIDFQNNSAVTKRRRGRRLPRPGKRSQRVSEKWPEEKVKTRGQTGAATLVDMVGVGDGLTDHNLTFDPKTERDKVDTVQRQRLDSIT